MIDWLKNYWVELAFAAMILAFCAFGGWMINEDNKYEDNQDRKCSQAGGVRLSEKPHLCIDQNGGIIPI